MRQVEVLDRAGAAKTAQTVAQRYSLVIFTLSVQLEKTVLNLGLLEQKVFGWGVGQL